MMTAPAHAGIFRDPAVPRVITVVGALLIARQAWGYGDSRARAITLVSAAVIIATTGYRIYRDYANVPA